MWCPRTHLERSLKDYFMKRSEDIIKSILKTSPELPPDSILDQLKFKMHKIESPEYPGSYYITDSNWKKRNQAIKDLYENFSPNEKKVIRRLLKEEIKYGRKSDHSSKSLKVCAFMLYKIMSVEDVPLLYEAKFDCNMDASIELDIELVFGLNKGETRQHYQGQPNRRNIIKAIEKYENRPHKERKEYITYFERHRIPYLLEDEE